MYRLNRLKTAFLKQLIHALGGIVMEKDKMLQEAVIRMKELGLQAEVINNFVESGKIFSCIDGINYELNNEKLLAVREFGNKFECLPFYVIENQMLGGTILNILQVSKYEEEWEDELIETSAGYPLAYVHVMSGLGCSEFGSIQVIRFNGGLKRIA